MWNWLIRWLRGPRVVEGGPRVASGPEPDPDSRPTISPQPDARALPTAAEVEREVLSTLSSLTLFSPAERQLVTALSDAVRTRSMTLPAFPDVARRLEVLLEDPLTSIARVAAVAERDPAIVNRIWAQASGVAYVRPLSSFHHAVARLGFDELWRIAVHVGLRSSLFAVPGFQGSADHVRDHSLLVSELAANLSGNKRGPAFLAGLLHDAGKLAVYRHCMAASPTLAASPGSVALVEELAQRLHPQLGFLLAQTWKLGDDVAAAILYHHRPGEAPLPAQRMARVLAIADEAAHIVESEGEPGMLQGPPRDLLLLDGVDAVGLARKIAIDLRRTAA